MATLEIRGLDQLLRRLNAVQVERVLRPPMVRSVERVRAHIGSYARSAGTPTASYIRGRGPTLRDGSVRRLTSQHLGKRWTVEVKTNGSNLIGIVGNDTTYGPYVQSAEHQARHHAMRGWKTDVDVLEDETPWIQREFERAVQAALEG